MRCNLFPLILAIAALGLVTGQANAVILGPYASDTSTLHLWHLDEADPGPAAPASGVTGSFNLTPFNGATLGSAAFAGFGTAGNTSGGGDDAFQGNTVSVGSLTGASDEFTMEALVNLSSTDGNNAIVMMDNSSGNSVRPFQFKIQNGDLKFLNISGGLQTLPATLPSTGPDAFVANEWFHAAVTYNGSENTADNLKLYWTRLDPARVQANEIFSGNMLNDLGGNNSTLGIGNEFRGTPGENLAGLIDEVRLSDSVRGPSDFVFSTVIPEPSTFLIWALGLLGLGWYARRRRTK